MIDYDNSVGIASELWKTTYIQTVYEMIQLITETPTFDTLTFLFREEWPKLPDSVVFLVSSSCCWKVHLVKKRMS